MFVFFNVKVLRFLTKKIFDVCRTFICGDVNERESLFAINRALCLVPCKKPLVPLFYFPSVDLISIDLLL